MEFKDFVDYPYVILYLNSTINISLQIIFDNI